MSAPAEKSTKKRSKSFNRCLNDALKTMPSTQQGNFTIYTPADFEKALAIAKEEYEKENPNALQERP